MADKSKRLTVSEALKRAIRACPGSLNEKGRRSGIHPAVMSRFLNGKTLTLETADRLAAWLGLELRPVGQDKPTKAKTTKAATKRGGKAG